MTISDRDRKKLWGQAAARCSMCRLPLVHGAEHPDDRDTLIGEEAHIISASRGGPRGERGVPGMDFDKYYNLILLCRIDHRIVDEQPHAYAVGKLRDIKSRHECWVRERLYTVSDDSGSVPVGLKPKYPGRGMILRRLTTGKDAWLTVIGSCCYLFESIGEEEASAEACDAADRVLTSLRDYGEIHDAITDGGFEGVRAAQRDLRQQLDELGDHNLVVFGAQRDMIIANGNSPSSQFPMAVIVIRPRAEVDDESELAVAFPAGR